MSKLDSVFSKACSEITQNLLMINQPTKKQVKEEIKRICAKYSLERIPRNHEILSMAKESEFGKLRKVLLKKPAKTVQWLH
jgi:elongator complex protein 3